MSASLFLAVDTPSLDRARALVEMAGRYLGGVKLGLEFFAANGPAGVRTIADCGLPVFLDLKLHDIPNTVGKAVAALAPLSPAVLTVHAGGGAAMMAAAKAAAPGSCKVVAVTVLTSLDDEDLASVGVPETSEAQVGRLAALARAAGCDGIVCSGVEVAAIRASWPDSYLVVPGLRPTGGASADQKRVLTPAEAQELGASMLVVGRPITESADPATAAKAIASSLRPAPALTAGA